MRKSFFTASLMAGAALWAASAATVTPRFYERGEAEAIEVRAEAMPSSTALMEHHRLMLPRSGATASASPAGDYINIYLPYGTQQIAGRQVTENVTVTMDADGNVEFDGLLRQGAGTLEGDTWHYANPVNLKGTFDPATMTVTCPGGQQLATYIYNEVDKRVQIYAADMGAGKIDETAPIKWELSGDKLTCLSDLYVRLTDNATGETETHAVAVAPVLNRANAVIEYIFTRNGDTYYKLSMPFWYQFVKKSGIEYMRVALLTQLEGRGYVTEWKVEGDRAIASKQVAWSERLFTSNKTYNLVSAMSTGVCVDTVVADISRRDSITFPHSFGGREFPFWACQDYANYNFGINQAAVIMGDPGETVDLGSGGDTPFPEDRSTPFISFFTTTSTSYQPGKTITEPVYITINEDNTVEIDGISGIGVKAAADNAHMTDIFNAAGTYDPEKKTISLKAGQMLSKLDGTIDLRLMWGELQPPYTETGNPTYNSRNTIIFDQVNDSTWQCRNDIVIQTLKRTIPQGVYSTTLQPTLRLANGTLSYETAGNGDAATVTKVKQPVWYEFTTRDGKEYLTTSNLAIPARRGYTVEWNVDGRRARATNAVAYSYDNSLFYLCSIGSDGKPIKSVEANINRRDKIVLPAAYAQWAVWDVDGGQHLGINSSATIEGRPNDWGLLEPEPEVPETLGVIGELSAGSWDPTKVAMLDKDGSVFSGTVNMSGAYFSLCQHPGKSLTDWAGLGTRYGALSDGAAVGLNVPVQFVAGNGDNAFKISVDEVQFPMNVTFVVDFETMTLKLAEAVGTGVESVAASLAPVLYYNLQGLPVSAPVKGLIYIKRQGDTITKVIY